MARPLRRPDRVVIARELMNGPVAVVACRVDWTVELGQCVGRAAAGDRSHRTQAGGFRKRRCRLPATAANRRSCSSSGQDGDPFWAFTAQSETPHGHVLQIFEADAYVRAARHAGLQGEHLAPRHRGGRAWRVGLQRQQRGAVLFRCLEDHARLSARRRKSTISTRPGKPGCIRRSAECARTCPPAKQRRDPHFNFEYRERRLDGRWIWILARGRTVAWDENGKPTRMIGTDIDITKIKDEEAARAAEPRWPTGSILPSWKRRIAPPRRPGRRPMPLPGWTPCRTSPIAALLARRSNGWPTRARRHSPSCWWTSTASSRSTTCTATRSATSSSRNAAGGWPKPLAGRALPPGLAATNSASCWSAASRDRGDRRRCADRLIAELSRPISIDDFEVEIGASVGLAAYPAHSDDPHALFRYADMALYEAKLTARGRGSLIRARSGRMPNGKQRWNRRCAVRSPRRKSSPISSRLSICAQARWPSSRCSLAGSIQRMAW